VGFFLGFGIEVGEPDFQQVVGAAYGVGSVGLGLEAHVVAVEGLGVGVVGDRGLQGGDGAVWVVFSGEAGELAEGVGGVAAEVFAFGFGPFVGEVFG
jgi:hypothetical protein